jgi:hypothetical protein
MMVKRSDETINPLNADDMTDLQDAVNRSRIALSYARTNRRKMIEQYVGSHYGREGSSEKVPVPLLEQMIAIFMRSLVANAPKVLIHTPHLELKPTAEVFTQVSNALIRQIELGETFRLWALDALFDFGIVKVGRAVGPTVTTMGFEHRITNPYCDRVSLDDWVHDTGSARWEKCTFMGNLVRVSMEEMRNFGDLYDKAGLDQLQVVEDRQTDETGTQRSEQIALGSEGCVDWKDQTLVWELYLPMENLLLTLPASRGGQNSLDWTKPLLVREYEGPDEGPFHRLYFGDVPDNIMPLAPVHTLIDLHMLANNLFRKLDDQARRQKEFGVGQKGGETDAVAIMDVKDAAVIMVEDPAAFTTARIGGPDQVNLAFFMAVTQLFSKHAGNLDALGGLQPTAETLGQEELMASGASKKLSGMRARMLSATEKVVRALNWYLWDEPFGLRPYELKTPDSGMTISGLWRPSDRMGDFMQYNFDIDQYSMVDITPAQRFAQLMQFVQNVLMPALPMLQAEGGRLNFKALLKLAERQGGLHEISELVEWAGGPPIDALQPLQDIQQPAKPAVTTRRYERINKPGASQQGNEATMMRSLLGQNPQGAEMAGLARS